MLNSCLQSLILMIDLHLLPVLFLANYENITSAALTFPKGIWRERERYRSIVEPAAEQTIENVICEQTRQWVLW